MPEAPRLDVRLLAAARLVKPGLPAADVGCDHGKLAAWLACTGTCPKVIACDLRPGPLAAAKATCEGCGCADRVELRLGSGLEVVRPGEVSTVVLAGISAQTTIEILQAAPWVRSAAVRLVCVPATKAPVLRGWLWRQGFALRQETLARAAGRWYTAMCAEYCGVPREPGGMECLLGLTYGQPGAAGYLRQTAEKLQKYRRGLSDDPAGAAAVDALLRALQQQEQGEK